MSRKTSLIIALAVVIFGYMTSAFAWEVNLQWDDPNNDPVLVTGYNLRYRRPAVEMSYIIPPIDVGDNLTFMVTNLQNGFEYCFVVSAYALDIPESGYSNELCINSSFNSKPVVNIEQPVAGSTIFGTQVLRVRVTDSNDADGSHVVTVDINNIGNWIQAAYNAVSKFYETIWNTATIELPLPQLVELAAIAVDPVGLVSDPALITVTVTTPSIRTLFSPFSIPTIPADNDSNAVELGVRFTSDIAGLVTGIRFYKGLTNIGPHTGSLWTSDGQLLGTVLFIGETPDGWQEALFANPIAITANTTYVVSYYTPSGNYALDENYFIFPIDNAPLHAPAIDNGVYQYGLGGTFPSSTYNASNYWVDVVMTP